MRNSLLGSVTATLTSADIPATLDAISARGIRVYRVQSKSELDAELTVARADYRKLRALAEHRGDSLRLKSRGGLYWLAKAFFMRPVLMLGIGTIFLATLLIPNYVLFVRFEGYQTVSENELREAAQECGISFGATRRTVRSERVKNAMLEQLPSLAWVGVNTRGCVATVSARERSDVQKTDDAPQVSHIVAGVDGVILSATVQSGDIRCAVGEAVVAGQVLISGYTDCGICTRAERANGEIFARTMRAFSAKILQNTAQKGEITAVKKNYSLTIGKKRINLCNNSGILGSSCGRMYEEKKLTLPGGFVLPITLTIETVTYYDLQATARNADEISTELRDFATLQMRSQMIAGTIDDAVYTYQEEQDALRLDAVFWCTEMIGREITEKNGEQYG